MTTRIAWIIVLKNVRLSNYLFSITGLPSTRRRGEGVAALEKCLAICELMVAEHPEKPEFRYEKAKSLITMGDIDELERCFEGANEKQAEAMQILGDLVERFPPCSTTRSSMLKASRT